MPITELWERGSHSSVFVFVFVFVSLTLNSQDSSSHPEACQEGDGAGGDDAGSVLHLGCGNGLRQRDAVYHHQQQQGEQQQQVAEGLLHGNACFECRG